MVVEMLLTYDATIIVPSRCYRSDADALQTPSLEGHEKIVVMLLIKGAIADVKSICYSTALQAASSRKARKDC